MAEQIIKNRVCLKCGADVRPNTVFCYNCGSSVAPSATRQATAVVENSASNASEKDVPARETKLKSAAALQKSRTPPKRNVEVAWEEPDSAPNAWFLVVALLLILFAAGIFAAMLYIR